MIREEVKQVSDKLTELGAVLTDDQPNKDQVTEIVGAVLGIVTEARDFADIPQAERAKAISLAFITAGAAITEKVIKFSDEAAG